MLYFSRALLAAAFACTALPALAAVDLIVHNGKIYSAEQGQPLQQALAVENGAIRAIGSNDEILALQEADTRLIDLDGKVLMPGFIDTHAHVVMAGLELVGANLEIQFLPFDELEQKLRDWRDDGTAWMGDILSVAGMPSDYWGHVDELERRFNQGEWQDVPVAFSGWNHHTGWANQRMLERAGITADTVRALEGEALATIGHHEDMRPNGFLVDAGFSKMLEQLPQPTLDQLEQAALRAQQYLHSVGITAWMDPLSNAYPNDAFYEFKPTTETLGVLPAYKALSERGELKAHVAALMLAHSKSTPDDLETIDQVRRQFLNVPNLSLPGIKIFADGVAEYPAQSAAMIDPEHFGELVSTADKRGWLVHVHAIGDRAVREALNGIEQARQITPNGRVHSVTHLQMVNPKEFARFKPLNVIASMQLYWAMADEASIDMVQPYISAMAFRHQYPARSLHKEGATIAGASDWPVTTPAPWKAIYQAVSRKGTKGLLAAVEAIDRETMFAAYTLNAAKALQLSDTIGSLAPGKQADFIVLDRDVFTVEAEDLRDTRVLQTFFAGNEVYHAETF